ncbi:MAG: TetR/AcrR family transcriptional regulator [Porticoccus sp.]|nr:TetR/AcrR family transcriptional regulator [Porticoccus sp.]
MNQSVTPNIHSSSTQSTVRYQRQREKAIEAAASVFATKGYHGASTKDIATHLGICQGSLYYYFKSKETALEEVCHAALRNYLGGMDDIFRQPMPFEEKLSAIITVHLASYRAKNEALKVHNEQRLYLPKQKREKLKTLGSAYRKQLEELFIGGVKSGKLKANLDCHFTALSLIGLCNYWGAMLSREQDLNLKQVIEQCTELTLRGCHTYVDQLTNTTATS